MLFHPSNSLTNDSVMDRQECPYLGVSLFIVLSMGDRTGVIDGVHVSDSSLIFAISMEGNVYWH